MKYVSISLALLLTACAIPQKQWLHPTNSARQTDRDLMECKYEGEKAAAGNPDFVGAVVARSNITERCMYMRSYR